MLLKHKLSTTFTGCNRFHHKGGKSGAQKEEKKCKIVSK